MSRYSWYMGQVPVILGHLRDSMHPVQATRYDNTRVSGTREQPLPFRIEPMEDADQLWAELIWYGSVVAQHLGGTSPHALRGAWANEKGDIMLRPSDRWNEVAEQAYTVTAWLTYHQDDIGTLGTAVEGMENLLFADIGRMLAKYRISPNRLRTSATCCGLCGETAVRAEWALNRDGDIAVTVQCTVCRRRYDPEEVTGAAHLQRSLTAGASLGEDHQAVAS